ncbi:hypothetical protein Goklo_007408, partial [Gossypium klotzschianum]|nr:hypothetical protein [Gossypium klotzschianum]
MPAVECLLHAGQLQQVLRPGGVFIATTYILDGPFIPFLRTFRQNVMGIAGSHILLSEVNSMISAEPVDSL